MQARSRISFLSDSGEFFREEQENWIKFGYRDKITGETYWFRGCILDLDENNKVLQLETGPEFRRFSGEYACQEDRSNNQKVLVHNVIALDIFDEANHEIDSEILRSLGAVIQSEVIDNEIRKDYTELLGKYQKSVLAPAHSRTAL